MSVGTTRRRPGKHVAISGHTEPGYEAVAAAFADNFMSRNELGAACCMYVDGAQVVDLWGGVRNRKTSEPWEQNTMVIVWSATKGMSGLAIALAESRGLLDYDERVSTYWILARVWPTGQRDDYCSAAALVSSRLVCTRRAGRQDGDR